MPRAAGIIVNVARNRRAELLEEVQFGEQLAQAVPEFPHSRNAPLIALLSFERGKITNLASARRGMRAATGLRRLNFENVKELSTPITVARSLALVPSRFGSHAQERFSNGGLLPPGTFVAVVDAIRSISRESRPLLDRFSAQRRSRIARRGGQRAPLLYRLIVTEKINDVISIARRGRQNLLPPSPSYQTTQQVIHAMLAPCLIRLVLLRCANPLATRLRNFPRKPPSKWRTMPSVRSSMPSKAAFARWVTGNGSVLVRRLPAFEADTPMRRGPGRGKRCGQRKTDVTRRSPSFRYGREWRALPS
jgi:hypothetical protein